MIDKDNPFFWPKITLNLLDDEDMIDSMDIQNEEIEEYYDILKTFLEDFIGKKDIKEFIVDIEKNEKERIHKQFVDEITLENKFF